MARTLPAVIFFTIAASLVGCGSHLDKPLVTYERDSVIVPSMSVADRQGLYTLFPGDGVSPLAAAYLHVGDKFGFKNQDGKVVGVYVQSGDTKSVPLDSILTTEYAWKYQGEKQP